MDIDKVAWTQKFRISLYIDMQHGHGRDPWTWISGMEADRQHGLGDASRTWTCNMGMDMGHGNPAWIMTWTMDKYMHYRYGPWTGAEWCIDDKIRNYVFIDILITCLREITKACYYE
jgi:hypothetical protein